MHFPESGARVLFLDVKSSFYDRFWIRAHRCNWHNKINKSSLLLLKTAERIKSYIPQSGTMAREQQGRGRGRFQGQRGGQRGRGGARRYQNLSSRSSIPMVKQQDLKFAPHVQSKAQTATYASVKDAIVQYILKTFKDGNNVAQSIKDGKLFDLSKEEPTRTMSQAIDTDAAAIEQVGLDIKYQEELRRFLDRRDNLRQGLVKAYALIFSNYCNKTMQNRIEEHPDFDTKIENNPIELLEAIKMLMHDPVRAQYPLVSMTDALARLVNVKQMEGEPLLDYVKRFKQMRDVAKSHLGNKMLDTFVKQSEDYRKLSDVEKANNNNERRNVQCMDGIFIDSWERPKQIWVDHQRFCFAVLSWE